MTRFAGCFIAGCMLLNQAGAAGLEFEVASIRPSPPITPDLIQAGKIRNGMTMDKGRVDYARVPLLALISLAYKISPNQIKGPDWLREQTFDIQATLPAGATDEQLPEMLQALLADRFKLTVHRENKDQSVYALVVAKGGLKVKEASPEEAPAPVPAADPNAPPPPPSMVMPLGGAQTRISEDSKGATVSNPLLGTVRASQGQNGSMRLEAPNTTFEGLSGLLTEFLRQPVVDMTGLQGRYQVILEMNPSEMADAARAAGESQAGAAGPPSAPAVDPRANMFIGAVQKLGLRLDSRKLPVETIVVDHLEKTPTDN
jgi:uncharacterized protein (TIGR03435 family)